MKNTHNSKKVFIFLPRENLLRTVNTKNLFDFYQISFFYESRLRFIWIELNCALFELFFWQLHQLFGNLVNFNLLKLELNFKRNMWHFFCIDATLSKFRKHRQVLKNRFIFSKIFQENPQTLLWSKCRYCSAKNGVLLIFAMRRSSGKIIKKKKKTRETGLE